MLSYVITRPESDPFIHGGYVMYGKVQYRDKWYGRGVRLSEDHTADEASQAWDILHEVLKESELA